MLISLLSVWLQAAHGENFNAWVSHPAYTQSYEFQGISTVVYTSASTVTFEWADPNLQMAVSVKRGYSISWERLSSVTNETYRFVLDLKKNGLKPDDTMLVQYSSRADRASRGTGQEIKLSQFNFPNLTLGAANNRISFRFSPDFPWSAQLKIRDYLPKLLPLLYERLGPPAMTYTLYFSYQENLGYFLYSKDGHQILADGSFLPRLIAHELIHAWRGDFQFSIGPNGDYDPALSGFEEGIAEGLAFEVMHDFAQQYPSDYATQSLLQNRPYQFWSVYTNIFDFIKKLRYTGGGEFWTANGVQRPKYSIAATTFQILLKSDRSLIRELAQWSYPKFARGWTPDRQSLVDFIFSKVPAINGINTKSFFAKTPVFDGHELKPGIYPLIITQNYGSQVQQNLALGYSMGTGKLWWGVTDDQLGSIPTWLKTTKASDGYHYIDTQGSVVNLSFFDMAGAMVRRAQTTTKYDRSQDGSPSGLGWVSSYDESTLDPGLYREQIDFSEYRSKDRGATENVYLVRSDVDLNQPTILVGFVGANDADMTLLQGTLTLSAKLKNGLAVFQSSNLDFSKPFVNIGVSSNGRTCTYKRTLLLSGDLSSHVEQEFLIEDKNFNCVEDDAE